MAKVILNVEVRDPKSLTSEEVKDQNKKWELVQKLLRKNNKINAEKFALTKDEKEIAIQDILNS